MAVLPADIPTGLITGQYYFVSEDNIDGDTDPQLTVVSGTVDFTASVTTLSMPSKKAVIVPLTFQGKFDSQGNLVPVEGNGIGMEFPATDSDLFTRVGWTWNVVFNLKVIETGFTVNIPGFDFQVPEGSTQDLSELIPVDTSPGVLTVRGPEGPQGPEGPAGIVSDPALAGILANPASETSAVLKATYVRFVDESGNPLSGRKVVIKVSATTGEIIDIVSEV